MRRAVKASNLHGSRTGWNCFCDIAIPSVTRQESVEFRWLVFCNALSPVWFKREIAQLNDVCIPVFVEGLATDSVLRQKVMEAGVIRTPYLITTRIDNDDAISRRHLWHVQRAFRRQERQFILFPLDCNYSEVISIRCTTAIILFLL